MQAIGIIFTQFYRVSESRAYPVEDDELIPLRKAGKTYVFFEVVHSCYRLVGFILLL